MSRTLGFAHPPLSQQRIVMKGGNQRTASLVVRVDSLAGRVVNDMGIFAINGSHGGLVPLTRNCLRTRIRRRVDGK